MNSSNSSDDFSAVESHVYVPTKHLWTAIANCTCANNESICVRPVAFYEPVECVPGGPTIVNGGFFRLDQLFGEGSQVPEAIGQPRVSIGTTSIHVLLIFVVFLQLLTLGFCLFGTMTRRSAPVHRRQQQLGSRRRQPQHGTVRLELPTVPPTVVQATLRDPVPQEMVADVVPKAASKQEEEGGNHQITCKLCKNLADDRKSV